VECGGNDKRWHAHSAVAIIALEKPTSSVRWTWRERELGCNIVDKRK
jgi:hypothetical protein